jgi:hypothetical protein
MALVARLRRLGDGERRNWDSYCCDVAKNKWPHRCSSCADCAEPIFPHNMGKLLPWELREKPLLVDRLGHSLFSLWHILPQQELNPDNSIHFYSLRQL